MDEAKKPALRPVDAATLILIDGAGADARVLLGRRSPKLKFLPNRLVFPGGALDTSDRQMNVAGALDSRVEDRLLKGKPKAGPGYARALALAAIREMYEETGVVVGVSDYGAPENPPEGAWTEYAAHGCMPDLQDMHFVFRAITPPFMPRRFDTRFFALDASSIAKQVEGFVHPDAELVELAWMRLEEAEKFELHEITQRVVAALRERLAAGMSRFMPVPFTRMLHGKWRLDTL
jgi:8-oxo-dGTP pyrophosphatase MutT (NUDIX family)